jgi:arabinose-5-phosphate isomerase
MLSDALKIMAQRKISELPVASPDGQPVGLIDITDIAGLLPEEEPPVQAEKSLKLNSPPQPKMLRYRKPSRERERNP